MSRIHKAIIFFLSVIVLITPHSIFAQTPQGTPLNITLSPALLDITAKPGDTVKKTFRIRNNTNTDMALHIQVDKINENNINGNAEPVSPQSGDTTTSWFSFDKPNFTARPQEWTDISFSVKIPSDAAYGYYFGLRIGQTQTTGTGNAKLLGEVIMPLLLTVDKAGALREARLVSFSPTHRINEYLPVDFKITIQNTGNVHVRPRGNIFIRRGDKDLDYIDVNGAGGAVLPGGKRLFPVSWNDGFLVKEPVLVDGVPKRDKNGNPETHLAINWDKLTSFRFGKYDAHMILVYDNGTRDVPIEAVTSFWVIPYTALGIIFVGILLIVLLIRGMIRSAVRRAIRKQKGS